jgi:hypothetical protein
LAAFASTCPDALAVWAGAAGGCAGSWLAGGCAGLVVAGGCVGLDWGSAGCVGLDCGSAGCAGDGSAGCVVGAAGEAGDAGDGDAGDGSAWEAGDGDAGAAVAGALGSAGDVLAGAEVIGCFSMPADALALADASGAAPLIDAANAVRLARAVVSLAFVSSSSVTAAVAFDGDFPDVPVGFGSDGVAALAAPVAGESASSSAKILSAAAASAAHFAEPALLALASALGCLAVIFSIELTCFFRSAICDFAFPVIALPEMLLRAALAS